MKECPPNVWTHPELREARPWWWSRRNPGRKATRKQLEFLEDLAQQLGTTLTDLVSFNARGPDALLPPDTYGHDWDHDGVVVVDLTAIQASDLIQILKMELRGGLDGVYPEK